MANNPYKTLNSKVTMAREQFTNGDLTPIEFRSIIKGLYEDYLRLGEVKQARERGDFLSRIRFTD